MSTISKLTAAAVSIPNELTVAAANFNLDFSLMKVEAPKEYDGLKEALSTKRRIEAEDGQHHATARRLGALFQSKAPKAPHLLRAYGKRVSEISSRSTEKGENPQTLGPFAEYAGIEGTGIWAAATSGESALAVQLLACMLARIWKSHEAISIWVELVERRKLEIETEYNETNIAELAAMMAARQIISRQQLASWDASARAWLQTADADRKHQQTQLMLIISNTGLPINSMKDPYESVLRAWSSGISTMERLVQGIPLQVQDGAVLLAISSWHLYPDMHVLASDVKEIDQCDEIMNGALLTISTQHQSESAQGIFWSLPLSRLRYYSPPAHAECSLSSDTSRISMEELWIVVLGCLVSQWRLNADSATCCRLIVQLSDLVNQPGTASPVPWLEPLANAARRVAQDVDMKREQSARLFKLGTRRCKSFLNDPNDNPPLFFGLFGLGAASFLIADKYNRLEILNQYSGVSGNHERTITSVARLMDLLSSPYVEKWRLTLHLKSWSTWNPSGYCPNEDNNQMRSIAALVRANELYKHLDGASVNIEVFKTSFYLAPWVSQLAGLSSYTKGAPLPWWPLTFRLWYACIAMFETGMPDIMPDNLKDIIAISYGDSIYVPTTLLVDPSQLRSPPAIRRIRGSLGRSELALLSQPSAPQLKDPQMASWNLINHSPFDGNFENMLRGTSLHLTFTDYELPIDVGTRGMRDSLAVVLEAVISVYHRGKHVGDLDVEHILELCLLEDAMGYVMDVCRHKKGSEGASAKNTTKEVTELVSIDSWEEFQDLPESRGIVRANGNWQARLAITTASMQRGLETLVLPENPCLQCIPSDERYRIIVA